MAVSVSSIPPRSPRLPGAGDVVAGKYRLERMLKQGGMGAVWIATHLGLDERVALKFMDPRRVSSVEARIRFTREAKAAAQIRSKNIVQILDHGVDGHVPYIAMELLDGEDLGVRLRRVGRMSLAEASSLLHHIAHALDRAHAAGIVHRDLKPENIFLARDGDHEMPKILDFGIALEVQEDASDDSAMTQEGIILGTPYFMSPEQVRGRANVDHRSDLWSVGVILFRAITGIRPFGRGAPADVIVQICSDPIPRASVVARDLPGALDRFFEKALAREVAKRFGSAKEMASQFAEIASEDAADKTQEVAVDAANDSAVGARRSSKKTPPPLPATLPPEVATAPLTPAVLPVIAMPEGEAAAATTPDPPGGLGSPGLAEEPREAREASGTFTTTPVAARTVVPEPPRSEAAATPRSRELTAAAEPSAAKPAAPRSVVWVGLLSAVVAAVLMGVVFREKLLAPSPGPNGPRGATTIVLTAGTVMLMSPGSTAQIPVEVGGGPAASPSSATSSAPSPSPSPSVTAATSPEPEPSAAASSSATAATSTGPKLVGKIPQVKKDSGDAKTTKTPAVDTIPADAVPPVKKDDRDLGY